MKWQWKRIRSFNILRGNGLRTTKRNENETKNEVWKKWRWPKHCSHGRFPRIAKRTEIEFVLFFFVTFFVIG